MTNLTPDERRLTIHRLLALAKLLEHTPSTVMDEGPSAEWAEQVERQTRMLASVLSTATPITAIVTAFGELTSHQAEVQAVLQRDGYLTGTAVNVWLELLRDAQNFPNRTRLKDEANARHVEQLEDALAFEKRENGLLKQKLELVTERADELREKRARRLARGHMDAGSGIRIIDMGDDDAQSLHEVR